jgi:HSP20 family protein
MLGLTRRNGETALARPYGPSVTRWDPWSDFNRIRAEMDTLFDRFFGPSLRYAEGSPGFAPAVDLYETKEEFVFNAYLPGMSREDIHLEVIGSTLHLWGERKSTLPERDAVIHVAQGAQGTFDFRYTLPVEVQADGVKATYRNGVMEVRLPKAEWAKPRPVEVQIEG